MQENKPNILVIGDLMIDHYLYGTCERISPEAPVQVIDIQKESKNLGGAGNVLRNLLALGANTSILGVVGKDAQAMQMHEILKELGAKAYLQSVEGRITSIKSRLLSSHQQIVRMDKESIKELNKEQEDELLDTFLSIAHEFDAFILSDYAKGVLTPRICQAIISYAKNINKPVLVDPKGKDYTKYSHATLLTPNKKEASIATNININDKQSLQKAIDYMQNNYHLKYSLITLSDEGIAVQDDKLHILPALSREVYDVTGAGDTVIATLAYMLATKADILKAVKMANIAAAVVVGKVGSATASFDEINRYEHQKSLGALEDRIKTKEELKNLFANTDKKIVFTNGCFDILHVGHAKYLKKAKSLGDILVVGLNSDDSVRKLKGKTRPINPQEDRACLLSALGFVDYVVIFDEETPYELIKFLRPHMLVKGADYKDKKVVGSELVKEVKLIDYEEGKSTSNIIARIENAIK